MIIKYDAEGNVKWAKSIGRTGEDEIQSVASTSDGGIIAGGYFNSDSIDLGNGVTLNNNGSHDGMIIKYDADGEVQWAKGIGGSNDDEITSVAETRDGGIIAGGYFYGAIDLGNGVILSNNGSEDGMIIKYANKELFNIEVSKLVGIKGRYDNEIKSVISTNDGGYIALMESHRGTRIGMKDGEMLEATRDDGVMIIKYDIEGNAEWGKLIEIGGWQCINDFETIIQTKDKGYIIAGTLANWYYDIDFGNGIKLESQGASGIIIKYNVDLEVEWAQTVGFGYNGNISSITSSEDGGIIVAGYFESSKINLENGIILSNNGSEDGMIIKYDADGNAEWAKGIGEDYSDEITAVASTSDKGYIIGGYFPGGSIDLGNGVIINKNFDNDGIIKYDVDGNVQWANVEGKEVMLSINETSDGGYIAGGYFGSDSNHNELGYFQSKGGTDGIIIKYDYKGKEEWVRSIGGEEDDKINSIVELGNKQYVAGGFFESPIIEDGWLNIENSSPPNYKDGLLYFYLQIIIIYIFY